MAYLASKRSKFLIKPEGATDVRVDMVGDEKGPRIWLQCASCGDEMVESTRRDLFECPECGHEISFKEVDLLGQKYAAVICDRFGLPDGYKKKGLLWRFLGLFGSRKRLPAPKS
jgi:predicted RNA-binding Zn-ribbon protein involved in translation (DUF1610 family)